MRTAVWCPAACWNEARPFTASARPPVRANGEYSAVRCTTATGSPRGLATGALDGVSVRSTSAGGSACGRIVGERVATDRGGVILLDIILHHPPGTEARAGETNRMAHLLDPAHGDLVGVPGIVEGNYLLLEQTVELLRIVRIRVGLIGRRRDRPAGKPIVAFLPPPVQRPELRNTVQGRLHATRARRLEGNPRQIEPHV